MIIHPKMHKQGSMLALLPSQRQDIDEIKKRFSEDDGKLASLSYLQSIQECEEGVKETEASKYIRERVEKCFNPFTDQKPSPVKPANQPLNSIHAEMLAKKEHKEKKELILVRTLMELGEGEVKLPQEEKSPFKRHRATVHINPKWSRATLSPPKAHDLLGNDIISSQGCLKLSPSPRQRSYSNAKKYFEYRDAGYILPFCETERVRIPKDKAIAMANRIHCSVERGKKRISQEAYERPGLIQSLEKKICESILKAKREHMGKMYTEYLEIYKDTKPKLASKISRIYKDELVNIQGALEDKEREHRSSSPLPKNCTTRKSVSIERLHHMQITQDFSRQENWRSIMKTHRESYKQAAEKQVEELVGLRSKIKQELDKRIKQKLTDAKAKRDELIESQMQRLHFDHQERLEEIRKKESEESEKLFQLIQAKNKKRAKQIGLALRGKYGKIKRKITFL